MNDSSSYPWRTANPWRGARDVGEPDYYEILSIRRTASETEILRAYRKRARLYHPDVNPGDPIAAQRFQTIALAFEVLSDPDRRARYDRGERLHTATVARPNVEFQGFDFSRETAASRGGFREIFEAESRGVGARRGDDIEETARLTFEEVFRGTQRRIQIVRLGHCGACGGAGEVASEARPCAACRGKGATPVKRGRLVFSRRCEACGGSGLRDVEACGACDGEGRTRSSEWLEVRIPPGVGSGSRVRVPGAGHAGTRGAPSGDFVLAVDVEPHPVFQRDGDDLVCPLPVSAIEAALGCHIDVPTLDGSLTIEVPAGTQPGQRFRLRKRGMPRPEDGGRGDLFVEARIVVPKPQDDKGRALLEAFARLHPFERRASKTPGSGD